MINMININMIHIVGEMNKMLASLSTRLTDKHVVTVHSTSPYIITIDNFLSDTDIDSILSSLASWQEPQLKGGDANEEVDLEEHKARAPYVSWCDENCLQVLCFS